MKASKWYNKLLSKLKELEFELDPGPGASVNYVRGDGFKVQIYRDGSFGVDFPDGHHGSCRVTTTKDPVKALEAVIKRGSEPKP